MLDLVVEWPAAVCLTFQQPLRNWQRTPAPCFLRKMPSWPSHCEGGWTRWRERGTRFRMTLSLLLSVAPERQIPSILPGNRIIKDWACAAWLCISSPKPFWRVTVPFRYSASWLLHTCLRRAAGFRSRLHHNEIEIIVKRQRLCLILKWFFLSKAKFKRVLTFLLFWMLNYYFPLVSVSSAELIRFDLIQTLSSVQAVILDPRTHKRVSYFFQSVLSLCTNCCWAPLRHTEHL